MINNNYLMLCRISIVNFPIIIRIGDHYSLWNLEKFICNGVYIITTFMEEALEIMDLYNPSPNLV